MEDHLSESEDKDDCHCAIEEHPCDSGHGLEKPVADVWHHAWRNEDLFGHTLQVLRRLGGDVVEVDEVADGVDGGEEQGGAGADLVELQAGVERDVLVQRHLLHPGHQVLTDGHQEEAVAEGEGVGRPSTDGDAQPHDLTQVGVLSHEGKI